MKKQAIALMLTGAMALNAAACSSSTGERRHHRNDRPSTTTTTTADEPDTTTTTSPQCGTPEPVNVTTVQSDIQLIGNTEFELSDDYQYILPYTYSRTDYSTPDMWETRFVYEIGFVDQDGNNICDPVYNMVSPLDYSNLYIVGQYDENGKMQYGLLTIDGSDGTRLIYDGYYVVGGREHQTPGYLYMSDYEDGVITVDYYDFEINTIIEQAQITFNTDNLDYYTDDMEIKVEKIFDDNRAVVMLWEDSYGPVGDYLVDTQTGDILASATGWLRPVLTDTMFIDNDPNEDLIIYDLDGNDITGDYVKAVSLDQEKTVLFTNDRVDVVDNQGNVTATMQLTENVFDTDVSNGKILLGTLDGIEVYDKDLNYITTSQGHYLGYGYTVDDFYNYTDGDVVFVDYQTAQVVNLMTGNAANYNDELFYTGEYGFITADDDRGTFYTIYGYDLEDVTAGVGEAELLRDRATGELYIVEANDSDITKLYHVNGTDVEMLYQYSGYITPYSCNITGGILTGTCVSSLSDGAKDVVIGSDGNVIFECPLIDQ